MRVLVLGLGNDLLGDDAVGLIVVRKLKGEISGVDFKESNAMGIKLIDDLLGYDIVFIIDSIKTGGETGTVYEIDPESFRSIPTLSPHYTGVPEAIELARGLELDAPKTVKIFAIEVKDPYTVRVGLSEELRKKLSEIVAYIKRRILEELSLLNPRNEH